MNRINHPDVEVPGWHIFKLEEEYKTQEYSLYFGWLIWTWSIRVSRKI